MEHNTLICKFTNTVHCSATAKLLEFMAKHAFFGDVFKSARIPISEERNRQEIPLLASSIKRQVLRRP